MSSDSRLDAFESLFRSAVKDVFTLQAPRLERVLVLVDTPADEAAALQESVRGFLSCIDSAHALQWEVASAEDWTRGPTPPIVRAREVVEERRPDLLVTRRHQLGQMGNIPYTLGSVVDVLTQATDVPVLLLPPPDFALPSSTDRVMVVTDHLSGDDRLVNFGVELTHRRGTLYLAHVEDEGILEYYLDAIDKMQSIDSELARTKLPARLLKTPADYIDNVAAVLARSGVEERVVPLVRLGRGVSAYQQLMAEHDIDLLVVNTKDDRQDAMDSMAYALAVQIRSRPLLLL
ncbi:MAG: universal stress protein [Alphaproteobacteria bacterium]|nr:universal stress protein [Alphaproteobacteria bacterium]